MCSRLPDYSRTDDELTIAWLSVWLCRQERTDGIQRKTSSRPGKFVNLPSRDGKGLFVAAGEDAGCGISHFGAEYTGTPNHV